MEFGGGGGGLARGHGVSLFAIGGAYWPLAFARSDALWVRTWFGCVKVRELGGGGGMPFRMCERNVCPTAAGSLDPVLDGEQRIHSR